MKNKISFLIITAFALCANGANASECSGTDCDIEVISENVDVAVLEPVKYEINWTSEYESSDSVCNYDSLCPFDTDAECEIWERKPIHNTSLEPRAPHINAALFDNMAMAIYSNCNITANDSVMSPLLERYKMLMNASQSCCTAGLVYKLQTSGADDSTIYNFLKNDVNHFAMTNRCMVTPDSKISRRYSNGVNDQMVADVRNSCLCKNRKWFESLLQPFVDMYERVPQFQSMPFTYTYTDGLQRSISVSVNQDVQTALGLMSVCPD